MLGELSSVAQRDSVWKKREILSSSCLFSFRDGVKYIFIKWNISIGEKASSHSKDNNLFNNCFNTRHFSGALCLFIESLVVS